VVLASIHRALLCAIVLIVAQPLARSESARGCSTVNSRAVQLDDGAWVLMREDGKILTSERYCGGDEYSDGLIRFELCGSDGPNRSTYLTPEGRKLLSVGWPSAAGFSEGLAAVENDKGLWGYMNKQGEVVVAPQFEEATPFSEGLAAVEVDGKWRYIDTKGATVLAPRPKRGEVFFAYEFKSGVALILVEVDDGETPDLKGVIDHSGRWIVNLTPAIAGEFGNGLAPFWFESNRKMGFIDPAGRTVIKPYFTGNALLPFEEGLAAVYVGERPGMHAGFIDRHGRWVIPPTFDDANDFCGGLATVRVKDLWGFVDNKGRMAIAPKYDHAESFDGGIAEVYEKDQSGVLRRELINRQGSVLYRSSEEARFVTFH